MRLTYRDSTVPHTNAKGELWEAYSDANYNEVINKLAAYEDTGLEPEEIKLNMDGLDEYHKAEAEGRLVILPCKVGDALFVPSQGTILNGIVEKISVDERDVYVFSKHDAPTVTRRFGAMAKSTAANTVARDTRSKETNTTTM